MKLRTRVRDGLFLNWALPAAALPPLPPTLTYEVHREGEDELVLASLVLFRHQGLRAAGLPLLRIAYPQLNLRLYVRDRDRTPAVYFLRMLVPAWVQPVARYFARQPTGAATFRYPRPSDDPRAESWRWQVDASGRFAVTARRGAPGVGAGPRLGDWAATVRHLGDRERGYAEVGGTLRRLDAEHPPMAVWPLAAEIEESALIDRVLPVPGGWPPLHSAWLAPEIPFVFSLHGASEIDLGTGPIPQTAASSRTRL